MKILITGSRGFIGRNLLAELKNRGYTEIFQFDRDTDLSLLYKYCKEVDFVFHLAGVNRPIDQSEFIKGNVEFTSTLLNALKASCNRCPVMISSSVQAELNNSYGESKRAGEHLLFDYNKETGSRVLIYRLPNVFGKWSKPNYNSAIATFCHNIARDLPVEVKDPDKQIKLVYIDDVINELLNSLEGKENKVNQYCEVATVHSATLGDIVNLISTFRRGRLDNTVPNMSDEFTRKLYSTYLSFLPEDQFSYDLKMNEDFRGSFTEFIKTPDRGQISINISKPGITKGNHWHHTKHEKFLVVSGEGLVQFRKIDSEVVLEYFVSGEELKVLDIPAGYVHNIMNIGNKDLVTIMWANEIYNPNNTDTYFMEV